MTATPALLLAAGGVGFGHAILPDHWVPLAVVGRTQRYSLAKVARLAGAAAVAHVLVSLVLGGIIVAVGLQVRSTVEHAQAAIVGGLLVATGLGFAVLELTGHGHSHAHEHSDGHHSHDPAHDHEHSHDPSGHAHDPAEHPHDPAGHAHDPGEHPHDPSGHPHDPGGHAHDPGGHPHDPGEHHNNRRRTALAVMVPFGAAASPDLTILPVFLAATTAGAGAAIGSLVVFAMVTIVTIVTLTLLATVGGYQVGGRWLDRWGNAITAGVLIIIGTLVLLGVL